MVENLTEADTNNDKRIDNKELIDFLEAHKDAEKYFKYLIKDPKKFEESLKADLNKSGIKLNIDLPADETEMDKNGDKTVNAEELITFSKNHRLFNDSYELLMNNPKEFEESLKARLAKNGIKFDKDAFQKLECAAHNGELPAPVPSSNILVQITNLLRH